jgi:hypothetical protein
MNDASVCFGMATAKGAEKKQVFSFVNQKREVNK